MDRRYQPGDSPIPNYTLEKWLGRGGFGEVWQAKGPGVDVALKVVRDLRRDVGGKELRALQKLRKAGSHSNLVSLHGYYCLDAKGNEIPLETVDSQASITDTLSVVPEQLIIIMDLAECNLLDVLKDHPDGIPNDDLLVYMRDAARGIDFLNIDHRIQHCDIKPANIFLKSRSAMVGDFGLAKFVDELRVTAIGESVAYSAPEISMGDGPTDSSDQYSLAVTYFELRTGQLPYFVQTMHDIREAKKTNNLDLARCNLREQEVLRRATSSVPDRRFSTCCEFVDGLAQALRNSASEFEDRSASAPPAPRPAPSPAIVGTLTSEAIPMDTTIPASVDGTQVSPSKDTDAPAQVRTKPTKSSMPGLLLGALVTSSAVLLGLGIWWFGIRPKNVQPQVLSLMADERYAAARALLETNLDSDVDKILGDQWHKQISDALASAKTESDAADQLQASRENLNNYAKFYPEQAKGLYEILGGKTDAWRKEISTRLQQFLTEIRSGDSEQQAKVYEAAQQIYAVATESEFDQKDDVEQAWKLQLLCLWLEHRNEGIQDVDQFNSDLQALEQTAQSEALSVEEQGPLLEYLKACEQLARLSSATNVPIRKLFEALKVADSLKAPNAPTGDWSPNSTDQESLRKWQQLVCEQMVTVAGGRFMPVDEFEQYYNYLESNLSTPNENVSLGLANTHIAKGELKPALDRLKNLKSQDAQTEFRLLGLLQNHLYPVFEKSYGESVLSPPVKNALGKLAITGAMAKIRLSATVAEKSTAYFQDAILLFKTAQRLNTKQDDPGKLAGGISKLERELVNLVQSHLVNQIQAPEGDFPTLLEQCRFAKVEQATDPRLRYFQIECELESQTESLSPVPASPLPESYQAYGAYVSNIVAANQGNLDESSLDQLVATASNNSALLVPHRQQRLATVLVTAASRSSRSTTWDTGPFSTSSEAQRFVDRLELAYQLGHKPSYTQEIFRLAALWQTDSPARDKVKESRRVLGLYRDSFFEAFDSPKESRKSTEAFVAASWAMQAEANSNDENSTLSNSDGDVLSKSFGSLLMGLPLDETPLRYPTLVETAIKLSQSVPAPEPEEKLLFARLHILGGQTTTATSQMKAAAIKLPQAKIEYDLLQAAEGGEFKLYQELATEAKSVPERVLLALRSQLMKFGLDRLESTEQLPSEEIFQRLAVAGSMLDGLASNRSTYRSRIEKITAQHLAALRMNVLNRAPSASSVKDFTNLKTLCELLKIDVTEQGPLAFIRTECELETKQPRLTPLPNRPLPQGWQPYEQYVRAIVGLHAKRKDALDRASTYVNSFITDEKVGPYRRMKLGGHFATSARKLDNATKTLLTSKAFGPRNPGVAEQTYQRFSLARQLGFPLKGEDQSLLARAAWHEGKLAECVSLTTNLLRDNRLASPHRNFLIYNVAQLMTGKESLLLQGEARSVAAGLLAVPFANLATSSIETEAGSEQAKDSVVKWLSTAKELAKFAKNTPENAVILGKLFLHHPEYANSAEEWFKRGAANGSELSRQSLSLFDAARANLPRFHELLGKSPLGPSGKETLTQLAIEDYLEKLAVSATNSIVSFDHLGLAEELSQTLDGSIRNRFQARIDEIKNDRERLIWRGIFASSQNIVNLNDSSKLDFGALKQNLIKSNYAKADGDLGLRLRYLLTECDLALDEPEPNALPSELLPPKYETYGRYVRMVWAEKDNPANAHPIALELLVREDLADLPKKLGKPRLEVLVRVLNQYVASIGKPKNTEGPAVLFRTDKDAQAAITVFSGIRTLGFQPTEELEALALWKVDRTDDAIKLMQDWDATAILPIIEAERKRKDFRLGEFVKVLSLKPNKQKTQTLLPLLCQSVMELQNSTKTDPAKFFRDYIQVLNQVIDTVAPVDLGEADRETVAALLGRGGDLIHSYPDSEWEFSDHPATVQLRQYQDAIRYHSSAARYHYGVGNANLALGKVEAALGNAMKCLALDGDFAPAQFLLARIDTYNALRTAIPKDKADLCGKAIGRFELALKGNVPGGLFTNESIFEYMVRDGRSQALLQRANARKELNHIEYSNEIKTDLTAAQDDSDHVIELLKKQFAEDESEYLRKNLVRAYERGGNILEDFAWLGVTEQELGTKGTAQGDDDNKKEEGQKTPQQYYQLATNRFTTAVEVSKNDETLVVGARFHRGRCQAKHAESEESADRKKELFLKALTDFDVVVKGSSQIPTHWYWLGKARRGANQATCESAFSKSIALGKSQKWNQVYLPLEELAAHYADTERWNKVDTLFRDALFAASYDNALCSVRATNWKKALTDLVSGRRVIFRQLLSEIIDAKNAPQVPNKEIAKKYIKSVELAFMKKVGILADATSSEKIAAWSRVEELTENNGEKTIAAANLYDLTVNNKPDLAISHIDRAIAYDNEKLELEAKRALAYMSKYARIAKLAGSNSQFNKPALSAQSDFAKAAKRAHGKLQRAIKDNEEAMKQGDENTPLDISPKYKKVIEDLYNTVTIKNW